MGAIVNLEVLIFHSFLAVLILLKLCNIMNVAGAEMFYAKKSDGYVHSLEKQAKLCKNICCIKKGRFDMSAGCQSVWTIPSGH